MKFSTQLSIISAISVFFAACSKPKFAIPEKAVANPVAYIFKKDSADGVAFKQLLQQNGCNVTLIEKDNVAGTDLSIFDLIVAGSNTDGLSVGTSWTAADSVAIKKANKPVMFIGIGGLQLAKRLRNDINFASCAFSGLTAMNVEDASNALYQYPKKINVTTDASIQLYSEHVTAMTYYTTSKTPNITLIGGEPGVENYYPVAQEQGQYFMFGFFDNINKMTATGKDFLVNYVFYAGHLAQ